MHKSSMDQMKKFRNNYLDEDDDAIVYDFGSLNINGCYKKLFSEQNYTGIGNEEGSNVDNLFADLKPESADIIISGQYLDKTNPEGFFELIRDVLKPDGICCVIIPIKANKKIRMSFLAKEAGLKILECYNQDIDSVLIAEKEDYISQDEYEERDYFKE